MKSIKEAEQITASPPRISVTMKNRNCSRRSAIMEIPTGNTQMKTSTD